MTARRPGLRNPLIRNPLRLLAFNERIPLGGRDSRFDKLALIRIEGRESVLNECAVFPCGEGSFKCLRGHGNFHRVD